MRHRLLSKTSIGVLVCLLAGVAVGVPPSAAAPTHPAAMSGTGGVFVPATARVLDTRSGLGAGGPVGPGQTITVQLAGVSVPDRAVTAVRLNVTAVAPTAGTFITVFPDGEPLPTASSLNASAGQTISNLVTVPLQGDGKVALYNHAGSVDLVADLVGYDTPDTDVGHGGHVFSSLSPARVLDTRDGTGGHLGRVASHGVVSLQVTGRDGVPGLGIGSVVLNVTVVDPGTAGYVVVYPDGTSRPPVSNLNFGAGQTIPNLVIAQVSSNGKVDLYNGSGGAVDLVADLAGYGTTTGTATGPGDAFGTDGALLEPVGPTRILDTRDGTGTGTTGPVGPNQTVDVAVANHGGVPPNAAAAVLNVTATGPTTATYVTVYPGGGTRPVTSNLNVPAGATIANQVVVPVGADGKVSFYNHAGSVHLIADLAGYYTNSGTSPWAVRAVPPPAGAATGSSLSLDPDVVCAGPGSCFDTGLVTDGSRQLGLLLTGSGNNWISASAPLPADAASPAAATIESHACQSPGACVALGTYRDTSGTWREMLLRGYGSAWSVSTPPTPPGASGLQYGPLACDTTGCVLAGQYTDASGAARIALATGDASTDGTGWAVRQGPAPAAATGATAVAPRSAACTPGTCVVLARYTDTSKVPHPFLITGSGPAWAATDAPLPSGDAPPDGTTSHYELRSVSCGPSICAAAGYYRASATTVHPVLVTGASSWTAANTPDPADLDQTWLPNPIFTSAACPTADQCAATLFYATAEGAATVLINGSGTTWAISPLAAPDTGYLPWAAYSLACPTTACVTVGGYVDLWGVDQLAVGGGPLPAGGPWLSQKTNPPPHAHLLTATAPPVQVACASPTECVGTGTYTDNNGHYRGVLLTGSVPTN